ncbi:hypothetical protein LTR10_002780 [Elasticomyces elasticus]|uniref:Uncharacterized protein n=1 Tax=Elasticomyces elasticus TaxID=574655 RepID=A0AAN7W8I1_9PEZI|nr:hypothetical protein LTR10_002780 [Elasticomyces elasticus]KAK4967880.1 hypothetical protein LTR42_010208 [Elasticomyces elasticus]KAK5699549.1 hypothetical protein LTR97_005677 [Elasticomyces elasticus]KAK5721794.1 hypothetical protein LTR15_006386 [Elasticomyces elasticus]
MASIATAIATKEWTPKEQSGKKASPSKKVKGTPQKRAFRSKKDGYGDLPAKKNKTNIKEGNSGKTQLATEQPNDAEDVFDPET